jgi:glycerol kinase
LVIDAYFSATKLAWILDHIPNGHSRAEAGELLFGTIDSGVWKLTGGKAHLTDYTNASRTMLYNLRDLCWDQQLLDYFHIPVHMLPRSKAAARSMPALRQNCWVRRSPSAELRETAGGFVRANRF